MRNVELDEKRSLWNQILGLLEEDLTQRRSAKVFVRVRGESGTHLKEVSELSVQERRGLDLGLREYLVEQLLDRYLAEQGFGLEKADRRDAEAKVVRQCNCRVEVMNQA